MGKKSRRSNRKGGSSGHGSNLPMISRRILKIDKEASESAENMLWSKAVHKIREGLEVLQEINDGILKDIGPIHVHTLVQNKAKFYLDLIRIEYKRCRFDKVIETYHDIRMFSESAKQVLSLGFTSEVYGQLAMLRLDGSKGNTDKVVSLIDTRISEGMNDTFVVTNALEVVWILRNMKEYDAAIALGEKMERLSKKGERPTSDNSISDIVAFENTLTQLEQYQVENHQKICKDFCRNFLVRVQEAVNKYDDFSTKSIFRQRGAYYMMIAQSHFLCHQIDDKELSSQLCSNAIEYVEKIVTMRWLLGTHCQTCHQAGTANEVQLVCSGCRVACYCSLDHQRMTWKKGTINGMRIGHEILCPLMKIYRKWRLASKKGDQKALKLRRRLDRECLYFLCHGLGLKDKCFQEKDVRKYFSL